MSPNALGGPSTNRALTLNHFYYPDPEEYNSIDPILIQDVKRSIYQA